MLKTSCLIPLLLLVPPALAQVTNATASPQSTVRMQLPPPVSSLGLPNTVGALELSNYIRGDLRFSGGYAYNLYPGNGTTTVDDATFSVQPSLSLDRATDRMHERLSYAPTFDFYNPDSSLNTTNHTGGVALEYRFAPYLTFLAGDTVTMTSNTWSQPQSSGSVSGGLPPTAPGIIAPFAPQVSNNGYVQLTWQFSHDSMVGFGGNTTLLDFYKPSQAQGLFNSISRSGSAFYAHRVHQKQYFGGLFQYSLITGTPTTATGLADTNLEAHNFLGFYTVYLQPTLSISLGAGSQYYDLTQSPITPVHAWEPIGVGSLGWQVAHANFSLSYSRLVTEGQGIIGAYTSNSGIASTQLQLSPNWVAGFGGTYSQFKRVASGLVGSTPGGHTWSFDGSLQRDLGPNLTLSAQYQYLHQTYAGIPSIAVNPTSSRATASISYHFSRLLGR